jgi:GntR family transcriptional regulator, arabinose operon transcriptional repressor
VVFFTSQLMPSVQASEAGFREATGDASVETVHADDATVETLEESVWRALQQTFSSPNPPTAIFATFDDIAEMIYLMLPRLGVRVPQDVSLLGFGGAWREGALMRRLTSVVVDEIATGQQTVALLHEMRRGERPIDDNTEIVMELGISEGETLAAPSIVRECV